MINVIKNIRREILSIKLWLGFFCLISFLLSCKHKMTILKSPPGYNFSIYDSKKLEMKLREISGLAWDKKRRQFIAEEDNTGQIYMLNEGTKSVTATYKFGEKGDYEDIALMDTTVYILRSDGTIFKYSGSDSETEMGKLGLPGTNDFESMYYDHNQKALVLICKNCAVDNQNKISAFAWYPDSIGFSTKPIFQIDVAEIERLSPQKTSRFQPSAAAIQPKQQKLYILSSKSHQLAIADLNGKVEGVYMLIPKIFPQPEGICFKGNGDMYISNEGGKGRATILGFTYSNISNENNPVSSEKQVNDSVKVNK